MTTHQNTKPDAVLNMLKQHLDKRTDLDHDVSNIPAVLQDAVDQAKLETHQMLLPLATIFGSSTPLTRTKFQELRDIVASGSSNGKKLSADALAKASAFLSKAIDCETHVEEINKRKNQMNPWDEGHDGYANQADCSIMHIVRYYHQQALDNRVVKTNDAGQQIDGTSGRYVSGPPTTENLDPAQVAGYICEAYKLCGPILKQALRTRMPKSSTLKNSTARMSGWQILDHLQQRSDAVDTHAGAMVIASICRLLNCEPGIGPVAAADASALTTEKLLREHPEVGNMSVAQMLKLMSLIGLLTKCVAEAKDKNTVSAIQAELKQQDFYNPNPEIFAKSVAKNAKNLDWINKISTGTEPSTRASANHTNHADQKTQEPSERKNWSLVASGGRHKAQGTAQDDGDERRQRDDEIEKRKQHYLRNLKDQLKRTPAPSAAEAHAEASKNVYYKSIPWKRYEKSNMRAKTWTSEMMNHPWRKAKTVNTSSERNDSMKATTARISKLEDATKGIEQNVQAMLAMMQAAHQ